MLCLAMPVSSDIPSFSGWQAGVQHDKEHHMKIRTEEAESVKTFLDKLYIPSEDSHKGKNGKVMIIGGSALFHAASLWAAEIASHFADMVHYSSTTENNEILLSLKKTFRNGIVVHQKDIPSYIEEDDAILIGPGMVRSDEQVHIENLQSYEEIIKITDEATYTKAITRYALSQFPDKKFVLDAGALQMMELRWIADCSVLPILTPHQLEFERLFGIRVTELPMEEKEKVVKEQAKKHRCVILLKAIKDIVSDGETVITIEGGNQGLTKGGTGDVLAGLIVSLYAKNDPVTSALIASFLEKKAADKLMSSKGLWYNVADLIETIPTILRELIYN
ncbi:NAD(P)H-hydrate dehydratase [Candidatus Roizmanbacteria bacterium]|nr:MAG: NAD(P)H-hydrate dehydratase [Candidatus Roizmanbacteria bacterium]